MALLSQGNTLRVLSHPLPKSFFRRLTKQSFQALILYPEKVLDPAVNALGIPLLPKNLTKVHKSLLALLRSDLKLIIELNLSKLQMIKLR